MNGWQIFVEVPRHPPVELKAGESIVGRSRTAQVHIPDSTVSRQHARLLVGALGEVHVEDLGSANGTYVNAEKTEGRRRLADGDRILIGDAELRVRIVAPVAATEATVRMVLPPLGPASTAPPPAAPAPPPAAPLPSQPAGTAGPPPAQPLPAPLSSPAPPAPVRPAPPPAPPASAQPAYTRPFPAQPATPSPAPPPAPPASAPPRAVDPPLHREPARPRRHEVLGSVTGIERLPIPEPSPEMVEKARLARARPAGILVRLVAALVDGALVGVGGVALGALGFFLPLPSAQKMWVVYGLFAGLGLIYPMVFWSVRGATPGKMLVGIAVCIAGRQPGSGIGFGPAFMRALGYVVSGVLFGLGFVLIAFTSQKQGLHDLIAGTRVLRIR